MAERVFITLGSLTTDSATGGGVRRVHNVAVETPGYVHADVALFVWALRVYEGGFVVFAMCLMERGSKSSRLVFHHSRVSCSGAPTLRITLTHSPGYSPVPLVAGTHSARSLLNLLLWLQFGGGMVSRPQVLAPPPDTCTCSSS